MSTRVSTDHGVPQEVLMFDSSAVVGYVVEENE